MGGGGGGRRRKEGEENYEEKEVELYKLIYLAITIISVGSIMYWISTKCSFNYHDSEQRTLHV